MSERPTILPAWWGDFHVPMGQAGRWRIGPLTLTVERLQYEWRVCRQVSDDPDERSVRVQVPIASAPELDEGSQVSRYGVADSGDTLRTTPVMPDRSVVTRPEHPITVLPRERVTLFVGSPVWIRLTDPERDKRLGEFAAFPATETWWGPNTREGEICYATRTFGRLRYEDAVRFPHRVMTAVNIQDDASVPLVIDKINLPVRRLSVYASSEGHLWTEAVTLTRSEDDDYAELHLESTPGPEAFEVTLLSGPRDAIKRHGLISAFGSLFR